MFSLPSFFSSRSRPRHRSKSRLGIQALEDRQVMSADPLPVLMVIADRQDFYYREYNEPKIALEAKGFDVVIAATTTAPSIPHANSGQPAWNTSVTPDIALANVNSADYSAIVFVGGWGASMYQYAYNDPNMDGVTDNYYYNGNYNADPNLNDGQIAPQKVIVNNLINQFVASGKHVAAICHGVTVLAWARVNGVSPLAGKQVAVPHRDGAPQQFYNGVAHNSYYPTGQKDQVADNGGFTSAASGVIGPSPSAVDDVMVDGRIITAQDYDAATMFGNVLADEILKAMPSDPPPSDPPPSDPPPSDPPPSDPPSSDPPPSDPPPSDPPPSDPPPSDPPPSDPPPSDPPPSDPPPSDPPPSDPPPPVNQSPIAFDAVFTIAENTVNGTVIGQVTASDPDAGQVLSYSIVGGNLGGALSIDAATGVLRVAKSSLLDYEQRSSFTATVHVVDNGSPALSTFAQVTVQLTDVAEGPIYRSGNDLIIQGTAKNDTISVTNGAIGSVSVRLNGKPSGPYAIPAGGRVIVYAGDGADRVTATDLRIPLRIFGEGGNDQITGGAMADFLDGGNGVDRLMAGWGDDFLSGGDGNDQLQGREGNDILLGGAGNDMLDGYTGRDLLIGGLGKDTGRGGAGEDLLIGGTTSYDQDEAALRSILAIWTSAGPVAARMTQLSQPAAAAPLIAGSTVQNDGIADMLVGDADLDAYFANPGDVTRS